MLKIREEKMHDVSIGDCSRIEKMTWLCATMLVLAWSLGGWTSAAATEKRLIRGLEAIDAILPWHDANSDYVTNAKPRPMDEPIKALLSKYHYPADDGYIDVVVWLDSPLGQPVPGRLEVLVRDANDRVLEREQFGSLPNSQLFFSVAVPDALIGQRGSLEVRWVSPKATGRTVHAFEIGKPMDAVRSGRVQLTIPNSAEAVQQGVPVTVGVPFPRGVLDSTEQVRLVNEQGQPVPIQMQETARWSRYGSIKWLLCDFNADLNGTASTFYLEYGSKPQRQSPSRKLVVQPRADGFPQIDAGIVQVRATGVYFDVNGDGKHHRVLDLAALEGGYVKHENGRVYRMVTDVSPKVETHGAMSVVLLSSGYYRDPETNEAFCQYHTRYIFNQNSPIIRIVHTWIYTGDSGRDRIADMGWQFALADEQRPEGFLRDFDADTLEQATYLLQHDHDLYDWVADGENHDVKGRLPGVMAASDGQVRLTVGIQDFWQNFPSELSASNDALTFHSWPKHGRSPRHSPATPDDALRLWFAHEGKVMDLSLPAEYAQDPIWSLTHANNPKVHRDWDKGRPENTNAQGVARTEEMWLRFGPADESAKQVGRLMKGLNEQTMRASVDPAWMAASGAFYEIHHKDVEKYPEHEATFETIALAPERWRERTNIYGMWIYGETLWAPYLWKQSARLYRAFRKSHHGWPYSWVPYARSGDPQLFRLAQSGTRHMYDVNFCHYYTNEVDEITGRNYPRRRGVWYRSALPWAGRARGTVTRSYQSQVDYLLHAYYMTGDRRAKEIMHMLWSEEMKVEENLPFRGPVSGRFEWARQRNVLMKAGIEMFEATHDPWALAFAHAIVDLEWAAKDSSGYQGNCYEPGAREFLRFTGDPRYRDEFYLPYAKTYASESYGRWGAGMPSIEPAAHAWWLTRDASYLRRLAHEVDWARQSIYLGTPEYYQGYYLREAGWVGASLYTSYYLQQFPYALAAFEAAGEEPLPLPNRFYQGAQHVEPLDEGYELRMPTLAIYKAAGQKVPLDLRFRPGMKGTAKYQARDATGTVVLEGAWEIGKNHEATLDTAMPAGTYWLDVRARVPSVTSRYSEHQGLYIPVTPHGTPEVIVPDERSLGRAVWESQYWFRLPEDMDRLKVKMHVRDDHRQLRRMSIWDAEGKLVWDHNMPIYDWDSAHEETVVAEMEVPTSQRGKLWRLTLPGRNSGFVMTSEVKPIFAVSADRWFDPSAPDIAGQAAQATRGGKSQ